MTEFLVADLEKKKGPSLGWTNETDRGDERTISSPSIQRGNMKKNLLILLFLLGLWCQVFGQTPAKDFDGSWQGTVETGGAKLRLVVTVTKSDAGVYAGKLASLDQGATIPIDTITVNGDAVRFEIKSSSIVFEGTLNKERTEVTGTLNQGGLQMPLTLKRSDAAAAPPTPSPTPKPKPDYSAPADAPYTAE